MAGEKQANCDVCCSYRDGLLQSWVEGGKWLCVCIYRNCLLHGGMCEGISNVCCS